MPIVHRKYIGEWEEAPFAKVYLPLFQNLAELSSPAVKIYLVLARHADNTTGKVYLLRKTIIKESGANDSTVGRALLELESRFLISREQRLGHSTIFHLNQIPNDYVPTDLDGTLHGFGAKTWKDDKGNIRAIYSGFKEPAENERTFVDAGDFDNE